MIPVLTAFNLIIKKERFSSTNVRNKLRLSCGDSLAYIRAMIIMIC